MTSKQKRYRQKMIDMGLCRECGKPTASGRTRCYYHLEKMALAARQRRKRQGQLRSTRKG